MRTLEASIQDICRFFDNDRSRLLDIVNAIQDQRRCVSMASMQMVADQLEVPLVEVKSVVTFYAFLSERPLGRIVVRVCNDVVDRMLGVDAIIEIFEKELGIEVGETTADQGISLELTPCIGMCDQAPAALINQTVFTHLTPNKAREIARGLIEHGDPEQCVTSFGEGNNAHDLVRSMVLNNIRNKGLVLFTERRPETGLYQVLRMSPEDVVSEIKASRLRGRGGAGFPTGFKWEFTAKAEGERKFIIGNADEGEPGTFKDRVLLTEYPKLLFEGMTIGGYAVGAREGILYLRAEYRYLRAFLEDQLAQRRQQGLLGKSILDKEGFDFDIRIQMGAGAYICGAESALISSCEGLRGDPKNRPPFPAQKGYLGCPTTVNNVETLCKAACILEMGATRFRAIGTEKSTGTKLLSVCGDCRYPGVYEFPHGVTIDAVLEAAGAVNPVAALVGGPSGQFVPPKHFDRLICFDDVPTGGAVIVFGPGRDLLDAVHQYMAFFVDESCGYCTPCRVGNQLLRNRLAAVIAGKGEPADLEWLTSLGTSVKKTSRCGLGQTSPNPILSSLKHFRGLYEARFGHQETGLRPSFDIKRALRDAETLAGRKSVLHPE